MLTLRSAPALVALLTCMLGLPACQHARDSTTIRSERARLVHMLEVLPDCRPGEPRATHFSWLPEEELPAEAILSGTVQPLPSVCTLLLCPGRSCCNGCAASWVLADELAAVPLMGERWDAGAMDCVFEALGQGLPARELQVRGRFVKDPYQRVRAGRFRGVAFSVEDACALAPTLADKRAGTRRTVEFPGQVLVSRKLDRVTLTVDLASMELAVLPVADSLHLGFETVVATVPQEGQGKVLAESVGGTPFYGPWTLDASEVPKPPGALSLTIRAFETDVAPGHEWMPRGGKRFRILSERTLTLPVL